MSQPPGPPTQTDLRVSAYDRVASVLIALLLVVGLLVFILLLLWLADKALGERRTPPVELLEQPFGRGDHAEGLARDVEEPGVEELADVARPQLADTLAALTTAVTAQAATLDEMFGDSDFVGQGRGQGDSRAEGAGGEGSPDVIPRGERWKIRFSSRSLGDYSRQLDFFNVELAALGGGRPEVDYAKRFAAGQPLTRTEQGSKERRLYFYSGTGGVPEFDRRLMSQAGIDVRGRVVAMFFEDDVEDQLALLEMEAADGRPLKEIRRTVFSVQSTREGYQFSVDQQEFR